MMSIEELKTDKKEELKPCPFCGGEADVVQFGSSRRSAIVECTDCGCTLESNEIGFGHFWNERRDNVIKEKHEKDSPVFMRGYSAGMKDRRLEDAEIMREALGALEYHVEQTRPIENTNLIIEKELDVIGSVEIRISRDQVLEITVAELISKFKAAKARKDTEATSIFSKVLRFYLDEDEFNAVDANT